MHVDMIQYLGFASERAKGWGPVWAKSGHLAQYYYDMLLARLGMGEGGKGKPKCWKQSQESNSKVIADAYFTAEFNKTIMKDKRACNIACSFISTLN